MPWAKRTVPVKASRVRPTTSAMTITAASGATGTQLVRPSSERRTRCRVARQCQGCSGFSAERRTAAAVSPYQARASTTPASPATATMPAVSRCAISAEARDKIRNVAITHAAVRAGGSRRHQAWPTPPWLSATAVPSRIGTAARYGQENGSRATPNISVTTGDNTSPTSTVSTVQDTTEVRKRGRARLGTAGSGWTAIGWRGQASWIRTASTAARASTSTTSTAVKPSQDWLNANSQRRSW